MSDRMAAGARKALWRVVLGMTGGLRVSGVAALPAGPCVIVANHSSHADTAALIAALPARLLAAGHDVIVYPEGTRSRDGRIGGFRHGAARLAALAGVPLAPAGITGTRTLLPPEAARAALRWPSASAPQ